MRALELSLSIAAIIYALILLIPSLSTRLKHWILPVLLGLLAGAQLLWEGFRWQLWPLVIAVLFLILITTFKIKTRANALFVSLSLVLISLTLLGGFLFPVPKPFPITGPYQVGTRVIHFVDPNRKELYGTDPNAPREFMAQVWYPAEPGKQNQQAQWMPDIQFAGPAIANTLDLPAFALDHLQYVKGNAFLEAPPLTKINGFPVLIFSHGWDGFKEQNIFQVEELASHGYVVIGINHTYGATLTVFPDGRQVPINHEALPSDVSEEEYDLASHLLVGQWIGDMGWVLDELENWNQADAEWFLAEKLDLKKVGILGHSTGAGASIGFCLVDIRCRAVLAMDLWAEPIRPEIQGLSLTQPALIMHSENWDSLDHPENNYGLIGTLVDKASDDVFEITLKGTKHYDFSSLPLLSPLTRNLGLKGPIKGDLVLEIINAQSVAFFDRYLGADASVSLEELSQEYPEVLFGVRP